MLRHALTARLIGPVAIDDMTEPSQPLVTYAQNREDLYLWALLGHRPAGRYVDVGCNHERFHSVTRMFYERGWSGINIDANERMAVEYVRRDRDRFVVAGVSDADGELTFRDFPDHDGLSTFDEAVKSTYEEQEVSVPRRFVDRVVKVRPLAGILDEAGMTKVDFLKIDVEGLEGAVLRGTDFDAVRPSVIVVEASRQQDCDQILGPIGYHIEFFDGLNTYYVDSSLGDVSIQNYADRVLGAGFHTDFEWRLKSKLEAFRRSLAARAAGAVVRPIRHRFGRR